MLTSVALMDQDFFNNELVLPIVEKSNAYQCSIYHLVKLPASITGTRLSSTISAEY